MWVGVAHSSERYRTTTVIHTCKTFIVHTCNTIIVLLWPLQLLYSGKFSLEQKFTELALNPSEENFMVLNFTSAP